MATTAKRPTACSATNRHHCHLATRMSSINSNNDVSYQRVLTNTYDATPSVLPSANLNVNHGIVTVRPPSMPDVAINGLDNARACLSATRQPLSRNITLLTIQRIIVTLNNNGNDIAVSPVVAASIVKHRGVAACYMIAVLFSQQRTIH